MEMSPLVRAELARHDWAALRCVCGDSAEHLPLLLEAVLTAETVADLFGYALEGHVQSEWGLAECSPPAVAVLMAALAGEPPAVARRELLDTVAQVAVGWADFGGSPGTWPVGDACRVLVEQGFWRLLELGLTGSADDADAVAEICELLDLGGDASGHYRALLRERVRAKSKRGARRG